MDSENIKKTDLGLDARKEILEYSLRIEHACSFWLGGLLGIQDPLNSMSLGNKSSTLSFSQKVSLLIDIGALDSDMKAKYLKFMEIRNQFMHNISARSYTECLFFIEGSKKFLIKTYKPVEGLSEEQRLREATLNLAEEVMTTTIAISSKVRERFIFNVEAKLYKELFESLLGIINNSKSYAEMYILELRQGGLNVDEESIKGFVEANLNHIAQQLKSKLADQTSPNRPPEVNK